MSVAQPDRAVAPVEPGPGELSRAALHRVSAIARREAGLSISEAKHAMIQSRLARRVARTGFADFDSYLDHVESSAGADERPHFVSSLTTNVSQFFREAHHFETLRHDVLPRLAEKARRGEPIRIWSAGCSSGQEPYSIAMTVLEAWPDAERLDIRILASDIDAAILERAKAAQYDTRQITGVPSALRTRYFEPVSGAPDLSRVTDSARRLVAFRRLNLIGPWPMSRPFDAIFCRNVVIYFDEDTQRALWPRFHSVLRPDGWFFLGHSERIQDLAQSGFRTCGVTTFQRSAPGSTETRARSQDPA